MPLPDIRDRSVPAGRCSSAGAAPRSAATHTTERPGCCDAPHADYYSETAAPAGLPPRQWRSGLQRQARHDARRKTGATTAPFPDRRNTGHKARPAYRRSQQSRQPVQPALPYDASNPSNAPALVTNPVLHAKETDWRQRAVRAQGVRRVCSRRDMPSGAVPRTKPTGQRSHKRIPDPRSGPSGIHCGDV